MNDLLGNPCASTGSLSGYAQPPHGEVPPIRMRAVPWQGNEACACAVVFPEGIKAGSLIERHASRINTTAADRIILCRNVLRQDPLHTSRVCSLTLTCHMHHCQHLLPHTHRTACTSQTLEQTWSRFMRQGLWKKVCSHNDRSSQGYAARQTTHIHEVSDTMLGKPCVQCLSDQKHLIHSSQTSGSTSTISGCRESYPA